MSKKAGELKAWRLEVIAELVWHVCPPKERAKTWDEVAIAAVYEYERDIQRWRGGDDRFDRYNDSFINRKYILNNKAGIRRHLRDSGREIGWIIGVKVIFRAEEPEDIRNILDSRGAMVNGQVEAYNHDAIEMGQHRPTVVGAFPIFEVKRLPLWRQVDVRNTVN